MTKMNNRVYGLMGIGCHMANWNADFTGRPKTISDGSIYGSDKAFKYSIKRYWDNQGEKVLYFKSYIIQEKGGKDEKEKLQPKDIMERYIELYGTEIDDKTPSKEVLKNLFSAVDVMNFGATFAVKKQNIGITGAVQVGQGMNKYEESVIESQDILSPFRNSEKKEADASSLGTKIMCDEAHYVYPFSVNPNHYDYYIPYVDGFEGYTVEAYEKFKEAALVGATALNTNSKAGCENEFALFVTCKENSKLYLPHLDQYIEVRKEAGNVIYDVTKLEQFLNAFSDEIQAVEVYYNPFKIEILKQDESVQLHNIFTRQTI